MLTGLSSKRLAWYKQLEVFGRAFRTIALDNRDIGDSDPVTDPYTIADLADDAAAVLKALGIQHAHIVGISMRGFITLQMALRHPAHVEKLVLVATSAGGRVHVPPSPEMTAMLGQLDVLKVQSAPAGPWWSSVVVIRKYVTLRVGRRVGNRLLDPLQPDSCAGYMDHPCLNDETQEENNQAL